ncbi:RluA family pseudouridine synthase [Paenibacillus thermotolerans]|uniref:RluA family pseudouridine synthase n=1 Tax=Paenibacillus thermotolerans TaxID=3027807 RepID=UPI00236843FD|nr:MULTISPECIES: RluA family pseudouridine synthase [unclassified Paenibacillus]
MSGTPELVHVVTPEEEGWRLRSVLLTGMKLSRKMLSRLKLVEGSILVHGERIPLHTPMRAGDRVVVRLPEDSSDDILPQPMPIEVLYEDEHLFIVNKKAGRIVHPTKGHYTNTVANGVVHLWLSRGETYRFRPIHRLDQDTSGVLAIAKNAYAHQYVSDQFQEGRVRKTYLAVVYGVVGLDAGTVDGPIDRDPNEPHVRIVTPDGYASVTHYETAERFPGAFGGLGASLVRLRPVTGRTHQIRVHMKHIGHPLVGDGLYARELEAQLYSESGALRPLIARQALHAADLSFLHPGSGERATYEAPMPEDMMSLLEALRWE